MPTPQTSIVLTELPFQAKYISTLTDQSLPEPFSVLDKVYLNTLTGDSSSEGTARDKLNSAVSKRVLWEQEKARLQDERLATERKKFYKTPEGKLKIEQMTMYEHWSLFKSKHSRSSYDYYNDCSYGNAGYEPLAQLYEKYGDQGNLSVGLGRKRVVINGTEKNTRLNFNALANRLDIGSVYHCTESSPVWEWEKNIDTYDLCEHRYGKTVVKVELVEREPTPLGFMSKGDSALCVNKSKIKVFSNPVEYIALKENIRFIVDFQAIFLIHRIMVKDMIGYVFEKPTHHHSEHLFREYTSGQITKIVNG